MYRYRVKLTCPGMADATIFVFAPSEQEVRKYYAMMNPHVYVMSCTQVGIAAIGLDSF